MVNYGHNAQKGLYTFAEMYTFTRNDIEDII